MFQKKQSRETLDALLTGTAAHRTAQGLTSSESCHTGSLSLYIDLSVLSPFPSFLSFSFIYVPLPSPSLKTFFSPSHGPLSSLMTDTHITTHTSKSEVSLLLPHSILPTNPYLESIFLWLSSIFCKKKMLSPMDASNLIPSAWNPTGSWTPFPLEAKIGNPSYVISYANFLLHLSFPAIFVPSKQP